MVLITHIAPRPDWAAAQQAGEYRAASLATEGFIHCSTAAQVTRVANAFYTWQANLVLLCIDSERVQPPVKFEPPVHPKSGQPQTQPEDLFPHVYGPLNLDAVVEVVDFPPKADGTFTLPGRVERLAHSLE
jgi:uncharacterized protein (DUF952 family)